MASFSTANFKFIDYTDMTDSLSRQVWKCRNLPEIRRHMLNNEPIYLHSHYKFIEKLKNDRKALYFAVLMSGVLVGSVNLHFIGPNTAERGIYIVPDFQGRGLAKKICIELYQHVKENLDIRYITTTVLKANQRSNALEHSLGAARTAEDDHLFHYLTNVGEENYFEG